MKDKYLLTYIFARKTETKDGVYTGGLSTVKSPHYEWFKTKEQMDKFVEIKRNQQAYFEITDAIEIVEANLIKYD